MIRMPSVAFYRALFRALLFVAIALTVPMAVLSLTSKQVHHDEYDHVNAARYYATYSSPPAVGDPAARDAHSLYGMSYLNEWDIVYLPAGKFIALVTPLVADPVVAARLFNVSLFLVLGCIALASRNAVLGYAILLTSPQIWYVFSYFNGDAFPLFVTFLMVAILAAPDAAHPPGSLRNLWRYAALGACIGLLVISKKTFWVFGLFAVALAAWLEFCRWRGDRDFRGVLRNMGALAAFIVLIAGPRIAYDLHINGSPGEKQARIAEVAEALAAPIFKASAGVKWGARLRDKGMSLLDLTEPPYEWGKNSFFTMFGGYNYNAILAQPRFYYLILGIYGMFLLYMTAMVILRAGTRDKVVVVVAIAAAALVIVLSVRHSWINEFQPQGRYLFAIFGLVAIVLARNRNLLNPAIVGAFVISTFLLSAHSFMKDALSSMPHFRDVSEMSDEFKKPE